jgi:hypothetical protein
MVNSSSNINIANTHFSSYLTVMVNSSSNINIANTHLSSELTVMVNSVSVGYVDIGGTVDHHCELR